MNIVNGESLVQKRAKILITDSTVKISKLHDIGEVIQNTNSGPISRENLLQQIVDVDALFCLLRDKIDKELLDRATKLKVIGTMSVGHEHIDLEECKRRGIRIGYTPGVLTESTAELGMALLLTTARRLPQAIESAKTGGWNSWTPYYMCGKALQNSTIGIYGMGKIGLSIADKVLPFNPSKIIYHNRKPSAQALSRFVYVSFEELLRKSDFLIICASASVENNKLFNKETFSLMKNDAILINISRGSLVNTDHLVAALENHQIGAAGIDVSAPEPLPINHPLYKLDNCVVLPHIGSATFSTRNLMASTTEDNIFNFICNKPMIYELSF